MPVSVITKRPGAAAKKDRVQLLSALADADLLEFPRALRTPGRASTDYLVVVQGRELRIAGDEVEPFCLGLVLGLQMHGDERAAPAAELIESFLTPTDVQP